MSDPGKGVAKTICFLATAVATVFIPPVGAAMATTQLAAAAGAEMAKNFVEDDDAREALSAASEIYTIGSAGAKKQFSINIHCLIKQVLKIYIMTGRNANIYFSEQTYQKLRQVAGVKISRFVSEAVEEKIKQVEQQKKEQLRKQLIAAHQRIAKNQKLKKELAIWDETVDDYINKNE